MFVGKTSRNSLISCPKKEKRIITIFLFFEPNPSPDKNQGREVKCFRLLGFYLEERRGGEVIKPKIINYYTGTHRKREKI